MVIYVSKEDYEKILKSIENPPKPSPKLIEALKLRKKLING